MTSRQRQWTKMESPIIKKLGLMTQWRGEYKKWKGGAGEPSTQRHYQFKTTETFITSGTLVKDTDTIHLKVPLWCVQGQGYTRIVSTCKGSRFSFPYQNVGGKDYYLVKRKLKMWKRLYTHCVFMRVPCWCGHTNPLFFPFRKFSLAIWYLKEIMIFSINKADSFDGMLL